MSLGFDRFEICFKKSFRLFFKKNCFIFIINTLDTKFSSFYFFGGNKSYFFFSKKRYCLFIYICEETIKCNSVFLFDNKQKNNLI